MTIRELATKMASIDIEALKREAVIYNRSKIVDFNRDQLSRGLTYKDDGIHPGYRSKSYSFMKSNAPYSSKAPMGTPDIKLTGNTHRLMYLQVDGTEYFISSRSALTSMLVDKYEDLFGLDEDSKQNARIINTSRLGKLYKAATGL